LTYSMWCRSNFVTSDKLMFMFLFLWNFNWSVARFIYSYCCMQIVSRVLKLRNDRRSLLLMPWRAHLPVKHHVFCCYIFSFSLQLHQQGKPHGEHPGKRQMLAVQRLSLLSHQRAYQGVLCVLVRHALA
jgi:hypothetical protein